MKFECEDRTRKSRIDPRLKAAGWNVVPTAEALRYELGDAHGWFSDVDDIVSRTLATIHELNREILREDEDAR